MFKLKNAVLTTAIIMALAACGGGDDDPVTQPVDETPTEQPGGEQPGGEEPGGEQPGGEEPGGEEPPPTAEPDATFEGAMTLTPVGADQILINNNGIAYSAFTGTGAYGQARGDFAPLQSFGLRVDQVGMVGQSGDVRVGLELDDVDSDALIQMLVDQATLTVDAVGAMTLTVPETAQAHVVVRNAAGDTSTVTIADVPADAVSFTAIADDPTSMGLTIDADAIMEAALAAAPEAEQALLQSMRDLEGQFTVRMAVSGVDITTSAGTDLALSEPLVVGDQPALAGGYDADTSDTEPGNGAGVEGTLYIGDSVVPPGV